MSDSVRESAKKPKTMKEDKASQKRTADYSQPVNSSVVHILPITRRDIAVAVSTVFFISSLLSLFIQPLIEAKDTTIDLLNVRIDNLLNKYEESQLQKCSNISNSNIIEIKIISPEKGDKIKGYSVVRGIICGELPNRQYMWIVSNIESAAGGWWPQAGPVKPQSGRWNVETWVGLDKKDSGKSVSIDAILVDESDNEIFMNYRKEGKKQGIILLYHYLLMQL
jgi:hypothetical protein